MAHKSNKKDKKDDKDRSQVCPFCGGSGKIRWKRDDGTDIYVFDIKGRTCPLCHGSGRLYRKLYLRPVRIHFKLRPKRIPLRWPRFGRHGRFSRSPVILPPPGAPMAGWPEGDMVPKSTPESPYLGADIDYNITDDDSLEEESPCQTILRICDNITITLGKEFHPALVLDTDTVHTNFLEALEASPGFVTAEICYSDESNERHEMLLSQIDPFKKPTVIQLDEDVYAAVENKEQLFNVQHYEAHISECNAALGLDIANESAPELVLEPHQSASAVFTNVLGPAVSHPVDPLDVIGVEDPLDFDINTDVTGDVGF